MVLGHFILNALLPLCGNSLALPALSNNSFMQQRISALGTVSSSQPQPARLPTNDSKTDTKSLVRRYDYLDDTARVALAQRDCQDVYENAIKSHSNLVGYLTFDDDSDPTKDEQNEVEFSEVGNVNFQHQGLICDRAGRAVEFGEVSGTQMLKMKNEVAINNDGAGYTERTIEFWMQATDIKENHGLQTIFEEGGGARGIHIFLWGRMLNVFMYNRKEKTFGKKDQDPEGFYCLIDQGDIYYFAFVWKGDIEGPYYKAYIKKASSGGDIEVCGEKDLRLDEDSNYRKQIKLHKHPGKVGLGGVNGVSRINGYDEGKLSRDMETPFIGLIDEFAIYNEALLETELNDHFHKGAVST